MRTLVTILCTVIVTAAVLLSPWAVSAPTAPLALSRAVAGSMLIPREISATATGINGGDLDEPLTALGVNMQAGGYYTTLTYHMDITAGTTAAVTVECDESDDGSTWFAIPHCTDADPSVCSVATLTYGITDASVLVRPRAQFGRCVFEDLADGSGSLVLTATVSAP